MAFDLSCTVRNNNVDIQSNLPQLNYQHTNIISHVSNNMSYKKPEWNFPAESKSVGLNELWDRANQLAAFLRVSGIKPGDSIAFVLNNSSEYVCWLLAIWMIGAVAVPIGAQGSQINGLIQQIKSIHEICNIKLLIYEKNELVDSLIDPAFSNIKPIFYQIDLDEGSCLSVNYTEIKTDDVAVLQFTSGSTGNPKGVIVTHKMMMEQLAQLLGNHCYSLRDNVPKSAASWLPVNHDMGLFIGVLYPLYSFTKNILAPPTFYLRKPKRWFELMSSQNVDSCFMTNSVLFSSLPFIEQMSVNGSLDLSKLHLYIAAEKVSAKVLRRAYKAFEGIKLSSDQFHIGYGMAENALGCTYTPHGSIKTVWIEVTHDSKVTITNSKNPKALELVSVGVPNLDHMISIHNEQDIELPDLHIGEIQIDSPCVTPGYLNNPEESKSKLKDGRLHTGDLGFIYKNEIYFYSRKDDLIVTFGRNLVPDDIELAVEELSFIGLGKSCLIAIENPVSSVNELHLLIESNKNRIRNKVSDHKQLIRKTVLDVADAIINHIHFCEKGAIEKTTSGKKRRKVIKNRITNNEINYMEI